jgi:membrane-bound lytic murein transglycosylase B
MQRHAALLSRIERQFGVPPTLLMCAVMGPGAKYPTARMGVS